MTKVGVGWSAPTICDVLAGQADLLLGLAQRGVREHGVLGVAPAAGERDLAGVALEVVAAAGEDRVQVAVGRRGRAGRAPRTRSGRAPGSAAVSASRSTSRSAGERLPGQTGATRCTRSSKATSPSSVRWMGHFAAMTCSRSTCSSRQRLGEPEDELELRRPAALGGLVVAVDLEAGEVPALALGVHLHRDRGARGERGGEQLLGARTEVLAADVLGLVGHDPVLPDAHLVLELALAGGDRTHGFDATPRPAGGKAARSGPSGRSTSTSAA